MQPKPAFVCLGLSITFEPCFETDNPTSFINISFAWECICSVES